MAMELIQNIWSRYGFRGNPFDTAALSASAGALLPVSKAIVGRDMESTESKMLLGVLRSAGGGRAVVEGDVGVGKTTFVNYHRYLWEVEAEDKLLTPATEITVTGNLDVTNFVSNIVGALLGKIVLLKGEKYVHSRPLLHELFLLNRVFTHRSLDVQASLFGFGGGVGRSAQASVPEPTEVQLVSYLRDLVAEVRTLGFKGIFLHFDNMELASLRNPEETRQLFERLRDVLQIQDMYHIFVAQRGFFNEIISPLERVRSVFSGFPIHVPPLTKGQLMEAIQRRYELLSIQPDRFIRPVDDILLGYLYDLYDGKMRFILDAVTSIVTNLPHVGAETLDVLSAKTFLAELVIDRLQHELTAREWDVLKEAVKLGTFTNADIARALKQQRQNISKYFNSLLDKRFIYPHHREGRQIYYCASEDVRIIRDVPSRALKKLLS
jgi:predicted transcriptional regulator